MTVCYCLFSNTHDDGPCNTMFTKQNTRFVLTLSLIKVHVPAEFYFVLINGNGTKYISKHISEFCDFFGSKFFMTQD